MTHPSRHLLRRLEEEEKLRLLETYQRSLAEDGLIPPTSTLWLRRFKVSLEYAGGILLGMIVAAFALLLSFVLFNSVLHIGT